MRDLFNYRIFAWILHKIYNIDNPLIKRIKNKINKALAYNPIPAEKKNDKKLFFDENQIVFHDILRVVGDGASEKLPLFSTRLFYEVSLLEKILNNLNVEKSLEIGCGYARLTPWIAKHSNEHYAIEPTKELYEWANLLYTDVHFEKASCDELPYPDNYFDLVITWTVLQHIPPGRFKKSIEEIKRVLKNDSVLVIAEFTQKIPPPTTTWGHTIEEFSLLFQPKKLVQHFERKVEPFTPFHAVKPYHMGEVMKFI